MNSRIRYISGQDGWMLGNKYYRNNDGIEYKVSYSQADDTKQYIGVIEPTNVAVTPYTVNGTSPHKVKIAIKKALEELGCEFEKETRKKGE